MTASKGVGRYAEHEVGPVIEAQCAHCHAKDHYPATGVHLTVRKIGYVTLDSSTFEFFCVGCRAENSQAVAGESVDALVEMGVHVTIMDVPREVHQAAAISAAREPLTHVEVDGFAEVLDGMRLIAGTVVMEHDRELLTRPFELED